MKRKLMAGSAAVIVAAGLGWQAVASAEVHHPQFGHFDGDGQHFPPVHFPPVTTTTIHPGDNHHYGPHGAAISTSTVVVYAGGSLVVSGVNFANNESVSVTLHNPSVALGSTTTSNSGKFSLGVTIPPSTSPGGHTITASGSSGDSASTAIVVLPRNIPPTITSGNGATAHLGVPFFFQANATGFPAPTFSESGGLPRGIGFSSSGLLSGIPAAGSNGTYHITLTATNTSGSAHQSFTLTVVGQPPKFTSGGGTTVTAGQPFFFLVTASGSPPVTFSEAGHLPGGVKFTSSGFLFGVPSKGSNGTYHITLTAKNSAGSATQSFTITVNNPTHRR